MKSIQQSSDLLERNTSCKYWERQTHPDGISCEIDPGVMGDDIHKMNQLENEDNNKDSLILG